MIQDYVHPLNGTYNTQFGTSIYYNTGGFANLAIRILCHQVLSLHREPQHSQQPFHTHLNTQLLIMRLCKWQLNTCITLPQATPSHSDDVDPDDALHWFDDILQ